jgi:hypothetical protein
MSSSPFLTFSDEKLDALPLTHVSIIPSFHAPAERIVVGCKRATSKSCSSKGLATSYIPLTLTSSVRFFQSTHSIHHDHSMNDDPWTNIDESGSEIVAETVAFSDYGDNRSANGSSSAYVNSPIGSPSGSVTYDPHADDTEDEEEVSVDSGRRPWVPPADVNHGFDPSSAILAALQESEFPPQMFDFSALAKSVHGERAENADADQMSQEKTGSLWLDSALRQPLAADELARGRHVETDRNSQASQSRQGDPASLWKPPAGSRLGNDGEDAENVETDRMSQASRGSRGEPPSLWRPSPSLHRPDEKLPMSNSMARSAQFQSASPSVASSTPAPQRQVDVSTQTEANSFMPSVTAKTDRIMDWIPDTQLGRVGYILDSLEDELRCKDLPIASHLASELKRLWYSAPPREPTQPAQPPSDDIPAQVSMTPSVVVEERDSNPPSVVSQQVQRPSSKSPPPPDRTIANSRRDHDTSIDDEIDPRPVEPRVRHEGPPSVIGDGPVKDTEKRWFDPAEWEALVTQLTSKMVKSTFEALQPTVREYVQQYLRDIHPAKVDPPLVEYLDEAAIRSLQRDPIVDDTHRRSNARSPPRGSTVNDTYYEPRERYEQDSRHTEYDKEPSPIARSQHFRQGPPDTRRYDRSEPSYQRPTTEAEYDANGSRYTSWPKKEVRWANTTRDSERTHPPAQRDFDDWMPRSSVPRPRNGMRIKFTQNGSRTRDSRRAPQVGGYDRFELKTEVPESRRQRSDRFQGGFNRGRRW